MNIALRPTHQFPFANSCRISCERAYRRSFPALIVIDLGDLIIHFGTPSVVEVAVTGPQYNDVLGYAGREQELQKITELRDVGYEEPLHYPSININVNRVLAGTGGQPAKLAKQLFRRQLRAASARCLYFCVIEFRVSYQIQVQVPQARMTSMKDIENDTGRERHGSTSAGHRKCPPREPGVHQKQLIARTAFGWSPFR